MATPKNSTTAAPATKAAPAVAAAEPPLGSGQLSICAKTAGFRRAGRAWLTAPVTVEASEFSAEQIEQLKAEPMLIVKVGK